MGTWIEATQYYSTHFEQFKEIINRFNSDNAISICITQELVNTESVKNEATSVFSTFDGIPKIIKIRERNGIQLIENLQYIGSITSQIGALQGARFEPIKNKMVNTLEKIEDIGIY